MFFSIFNTFALIYHHYRLYKYKILCLYNFYVLHFCLCLVVSQCLLYNFSAKVPKLHFSQ